MNESLRGLVSFHCLDSQSLDCKHLPLLSWSTPGTLPRLVRDAGFLWVSSRGRGLDHTWTSSEGLELGLTLLALKAREDFSTKRVEIHFWKTFSTSKGGFRGAELALAMLVLGQHGRGHFSSEQHLAVLAKKKWLIILG